MNINTLKGLGLVFVAGIGGGFIAQYISDRKNKKKEEEYQKDLEQMKNDLVHEINFIRQDTKNEMASEARAVIRNSLEATGAEDIHREALARVKTVNLDKIVEDAVRNGCDATIGSVARTVEKESLSVLKNTIADLATDTVQENLKDEMYKVNSRRIIEDAVDRAVRDEVSKIVRDKLKWLSVNDLKGFLL